MSKTNLFQSGSFTLNSGKKSRWKLELDALTPDDWMTLALIASEFLAPFGEVSGVPRGGLPFAEALKDYRTCLCGHRCLQHLGHNLTHNQEQKYCRGGSKPCGCEEFRPEKFLLIVDDVCTTGDSMEEHREKVSLEQGQTEYVLPCIGVCVFARGETPSWVTPIFKMTTKQERHKHSVTIEKFLVEAWKMDKSEIQELIDRLTEEV